MVTLETALAFPLLLAMVLLAAWILHVGQTQARLTDAARATAREAARGADQAASVAAGRQVLPSAQLVVQRAGDEVIVSAQASVSGPGGWLAGLGKDLRAEVVTRAEGP